MSTSTAAVHSAAFKKKKKTKRHIGVPRVQTKEYLNIKRYAR